MNIFSPIEREHPYLEEVITGSWSNCKYQFNIFKNKNFEKKEHLISVSFFVLQNLDSVYANQKKISVQELQIDYKKKFQSYLNGLQAMIQDKDGIFNVRIYCDITSVDLVKRYLAYHNVELAYYYFENFFDIHRNCHYGFFGTLMRYIPFFNFFQFENRYTTVCVLDLDNNFFNGKKLISYYIKKITERRDAPNLMYWSRPSYFFNPRIYVMPHRPNRFPIISSFIIQKEQQDHIWFTEFINSYLLNDNELYNNLLRNYLEIDFGRRVFGGKLEYGVDEFFINYVFLNQCYLIRNLDFLVVMLRETFGGVLEWLKHLRQMIPRPRIENTTITNQFLNEIVRLIFPPKISIPKTLNINDKIDWVAEQFYSQNLIKSHRKIDETQIIQNIISILDQQNMKVLNNFTEFYSSITTNLQINSNEYNVYLIQARNQYPRHSIKTIATIYRN